LSLFRQSRLGQQLALFQRACETGSTPPTFSVFDDLVKLQLTPAEKVVGAGQLPTPQKSYSIYANNVASFVTFIAVYSNSFDFRAVWKSTSFKAF
jgi:hypothetical protein